MPYPTNASLPLHVRHAYPSSVTQSAFRKVWNGTYGRTGDEHQAFAEAHAVAQRIHSHHVNGMPNYTARAMRPGGNP